jgi:hypothetical protein
LLGEELQEDNVKRKWVGTLGEAEEYDTYRDALGASALQGEGGPMHEREAIKEMLGAAVLTIGAEGIEG